MKCKVKLHKTIDNHLMIACEETEQAIFIHEDSDIRELIERLCKDCEEATQ